MTINKTTVEPRTDPKTFTLHAIACNNTTLQESLEACQSIWSEQEPIALLYSHRSCQFARLKQDKMRVVLLNPKHRPINLSDVFEVRIFNDAAELRWVNQKSGTGRAVLLSEQKQTLELYEEVIPSLSDLEVWDQTYVLWGEAWTKPETWGDEWSRLTLARIGSLPVPIAGLERHQTVVLNVREFLKADECGNFSVVEERLLGLEIKK